MTQAPHAPGTDHPISLRLEKPVYGGNSLGRTAAGQVLLVPFTLPGELVQVSGPATGTAAAPLAVLQPSPNRTEPGCVHFGACGGCQYQMAGYPAQLAIKQTILEETLSRGGLTSLPPIQPHASPEPWGYRNRIRLRVRPVDGTLRLGYSRRNSRDFLPIRMCPIATPILWQAAEALTQAARQDTAAAAWLGAAAEVEIACDADGSTALLHLLCPAKTPNDPRGFDALAARLRSAGLPLAALQASRLHVASGRATELLASSGAEGLTYTVASQRFWLGRGSFFQVNRLLLPTLADLVTKGRQGKLAWDLYAGVGLFARSLAPHFDAVTAVEANGTAVRELERGLRQISPTPSGAPLRRKGLPAAHRAVEATTLAFLQSAVLQRERPDLVVLDPPRAGAGEEVCHLLLRLAPRTLVYVSCDPTTLARDAAVLLTGGYSIAELHLIDLFPQTYHLETVMVLHHPGV